MIKGSFKTLALILGFCLAFGARAEQSEPDLTDLAAQQKLAKSFVDSFNSATPIDPISAGKISEDVAYSIADLYVAELMKQEGDIAGYKIGLFVEGQYDNGPVDGLSGPVTAVMFKSGIHESGAHISVNCCNMSFVEADFAAVVGSDTINSATSDLELLAALSGFKPFIEMPDLLQPADGRSKIGGIATNYDFRNGIIGELIKTEATEQWIKRLNSFKFTMTNETGEILAEGSISDAYDPISHVRHLRDQLLKRGRLLKPGDILCLGNIGAARPLKPNDYMDPSVFPVFRGNIATVSYIGLDPVRPVSVSVIIDR
jgi:2-keto-4-pentenoate hydratase